MGKFVLVPREPTRQMLKAMLVSLGINPDKQCTDVLDAMDVHKAAQTLEAYRAMVRAVIDERAHETRSNAHDETERL